MLERSWPIFVFSSRLRNEQVNGSNALSYLSGHRYFFCQHLIPLNSTHYLYLRNYENLYFIKFSEINRIDFPGDPTIFHVPF